MCSMVSVSLFTNVHNVSKNGNSNLKHHIIVPTELILCGHMPGEGAKRKRRLPLNENKLHRPLGSDRLPLSCELVGQVRFLY